MTKEIVPAVHLLSSGSPDRLDVALDLLIEFLLESLETEQQGVESDPNVQCENTKPSDTSCDTEISNLKEH